MRRIVTSAGRWSWRIFAFVCLLNLGWDLWALQDRFSAGAERSFLRLAERADATDDGIAEIRIVNETGHDYLIDELALGYGGWSRGRRNETSRTLARAGEPGSVLRAEHFIVDLLSEGSMALRSRDSGAWRRIDFQVDRRRPISCSIEIRIREEGAEVSECRMLRRIRHDFRWLFGPPSY